MESALKIDVDEALAYMDEMLDFPRIANVMKVLNWKWQGQEPGIDDLRQKAGGLLTSTLMLWNKKEEKEYTAISSGGFTAFVTTQGCWCVHFSISEANSWYQ